MRNLSIKRLFAAIISIIMVMSVVPGLALADGAYDADIVLTKDSAYLYNGVDIMKVGYNINPGGKDIKGLQTAVVAFNLDKFDVLWCGDGESYDYTADLFPSEKANIQDAAGDYKYSSYVAGSGPSKVAVSVRFVFNKIGNVGYIVMIAEVPNGKKINATESKELLSIAFGLKATTTWNDIKAEDVRLATAAEAAVLNATGAVTVNDGDVEYIYANKDGVSADTLTITPEVVASGFAFATDKPPVTEVAVPAADATAFVYNGTAQTYAIAANDAYTVTGATQTNAGTYTVTVALNDTTAYVWADGTTDAKTYNFVIAPKSIAGAVVADVDDVVYTGSAFEPTPAVTVDGVVLVAGADFDYAYENNTAIGTATVKVVAKGNYTGEASTTFVIADDYTAMKYAAGYSYKIENDTLYVKGADATIYVIEAKYEGAKMTSCVLKPVVITGGAANVAVDTTATLFIWDANMQAMN